MKLEEVLPAMREGRCAYDWMGLAWRISSDGTIVYLDEDTGDEVHSSPPVDNLTLERKVEWPKGSFQSAVASAGHVGTMLRRTGWHENTMNFIVGKHVALHVDDILALDWKVVS